MIKSKVKKAKTITRQNRFITISTCTPNGNPWITPVFYAYDDDYNLYWVSSKNARHSKNIRSNPKIAIVIFDSTKGEGEGDAIYIEATAKEMKTTKEIEEGMKYYDTRASKKELMVKDPENVTGKKEWRFYKAEPKVIYKSGDAKTVNGQYVDTRIKLNLEKLQIILE
jgi:nitroimidazol reductase NimA-like FMN-containing flavoprotein (pyridoxamine 5'-phosphate oxidase superfamily)